MNPSSHFLPRHLVNILLLCVVIFEFHNHPLFRVFKSVTLFLCSSGVGCAKSHHCLRGARHHRARRRDLKRDELPCHVVLLPHSPHRLCNYARRQHDHSGDRAVRGGIQGPAVVGTDHHCGHYDDAPSDLSTCLCFPRFRRSILFRSGPMRSRPPSFRSLSDDASPVLDHVENARRGGVSETGHFIVRAIADANVRTLPRPYTQCRNLIADALYLSPASVGMSKGRQRRGSEILTPSGLSCSMFSGSFQARLQTCNVGFIQSSRATDSDWAQLFTSA